MKLIFASAKDKIATYQIEDPYLQTFIYNYEKLIPWNKIKSTEDINAHIRDVLLPNVYALIDESQPERNNYLKDIDLERQFERNMDQPHVQRAYKLRRDEDAAKKEILTVLNQDKKNVFDAWWNYMTEENDEYKNHPSFVYMVLKSVFDSSPDDKINSPLGQNALAIATLYETMSNGGQINVLKSYKKALSDLDSANMEHLGDSEQDGWLNIPSKINDPENFLSNIEKLKNFSKPCGWCTGSGMAKPYLSKGDFWLFIQENLAKVAIRFDGNKIVEIQGKGNRRPYDYWEEIIEFIEKKGFDAKECSHFKELKEARILNERLDQDPSYIKEFEKEFSKNPSVFERLSKKRQEEPQFIDLAVQYWKTKIENNDKLSHWDSKIRDFNNAPKSVKDKLEKETLDLIYPDLIHLITLDVANVERVGKEKEFLSYYDYSERFLKDIIPVLVKNPWVTALLDPSIEKQIHPTTLKQVKEVPSYQMIEELLATDSTNPDDTIYSYMGDEFDRFFYEESQEGLDELKAKASTDSEVEDDYDTEHELIDDCFYDEKLITYVSENTPVFWQSYIEGNVKKRYEELERLLYSNDRDHTRYDDHEEFTQCGDMYRDYWYAYIQDAPSEIYQVPEEVFEYMFYEDFDEDFPNWYITAWIEKVKTNLSNLIDAKEYLERVGSKKYVESFYTRALNEENYVHIKQGIEKNIRYLLDEDYLEIYHVYSNFLEHQKVFLKNQINDYLSKTSLTKGMFESLSFLEENYDYFTDDEMEKVYSSLKSYELDLVQKNPTRYDEIQDRYKDDPEFIKALESTPEIWSNLLYSYGERVLNYMPEASKSNPEFIVSLEKYRILDKLKNDVNSLFNFYEMISPYKSDEQFYKKALSIATTCYLRHSERLNFDSVAIIKSRFGNVPDFYLDNKENANRLAKKISRNLLLFRASKLTGEELSVIDPRLVELMLPYVKEELNDGDMNNYLSFYSRAQYLNCAYKINPSFFQEELDHFRKVYINYLSSNVMSVQHRMALKELALEYVPIIFANDEEVNAYIARTYPKQPETYKTPEEPVKVEETPEITSNNWFSSYKMANLPPGVTLIGPEDVLETLETFGSNKLTIGFRKANGGLGVVNAKKSLEVNDFYDLQVVAQIVGKGIDKVNDIDIDPKAFKKAIKRLPPHKIEFIVSNNKKYIVKGTPYAEHSGVSK